MPDTSDYLCVSMVQLALPPSLAFFLAFWGLHTPLLVACFHGVSGIWSWWGYWSAVQRLPACHSGLPVYLSSSLVLQHSLALSLVCWGLPGPLLVARVYRVFWVLGLQGLSVNCSAVTCLPQWTTCLLSGSLALHPLCALSLECWGLPAPLLVA